MDETDLEVKVIIRNYDEKQDESYIYASWRNSAFYSAMKRPQEVPAFFFKIQSRKIKTIMRNALVRIACFEHAPSVIVGYSITTKDHLNWVLVKPDYRMKGIGTLLVPKNVETYTDNLTKIGKIIADKKNLILKGEYDGRTDYENRQEN